MKKKYGAKYIYGAKYTWWKKLYVAYMGEKIIWGKTIWGKT